MLELWFDFSCPYAYLASRRARSLGVPIQWRPFLLGGLFRGIGAGDGPMATQGPAKARHNIEDMHRWAQLWGEPFRLPAAHPMRTVRALRVLLGLPHSRWARSEAGHAPAAIDALYAAYWQRGEDVTNDAVIAAALASAGETPSDIASAFAAADTSTVKDSLREATDIAIQHGLFGAPGWIFRNGFAPEYPQLLQRTDPLLIWGQDRIPWVEAVLGGREPATQQLGRIAGWDPDAGVPPGGPRPFAPTERAAPAATLDVYFDVSSPFAYLGLTQLRALAGTGAAVRLVPILLGALFRDIGQVDVPLLAMPAPKARYIALDMQRWARWWGVPFSQPSKFPQRTVTAQRMIVLAADGGFDAGLALAGALGRAMWAEGRDLEDPTTLRQIAEATGLTGNLVERASEPGTKQRLIDNTAEAKTKGVFGVPTFIVNGKQLFWGQDRLDLVAKTLAGWDAFHL